MRGWVAISVTATPAAAPRRIREVLRMIIREPSGLRLRPTMGLDRREPRPCGTPHIVRVGLHRPLWQRPIAGPSERISAPSSEQDMISAAGIKDQELTGSAPPRPLRDLSIDRRNLHPVRGVDEKTVWPHRFRVEALGVFAASFEDMSMTSPTWRALGHVVLVYFAVGGAAVTAQDTQPGRATFAEMIAFA